MVEFQQVRGQNKAEEVENILDQEKTELGKIILKKVKEKKIFGSDERRQKLIKTLLEKIGNDEVPASDLYVKGYDDVEIYQALMYLKLLNIIELTGFHTIVREDGGLISVGVYKKK
jgi:hypothetical protein